jgi:hypothetical protein
MAINDITRLGTDVRKIARLLQAKAPPGHNLAYITPEEAQILKDRGGSGKPHADTGIPSYEVEGDPLGDLPPAYTQQFGSPDGTSAYDYGAGGDVYSPLSDYGFGPLSQPLQAPQPISPETGMPYSIETPTFRPSVAETGLREPTEADRRAAPAGAGSGILKQLGMGLAQALPGALLARRAARQAGGQQQQMEQVAAPYRQLGQQLQAAAGRGELAPAAQQSLQAAQAQLAQQAQARGGVGAAQIQTQLEGFRQQLLQQQMDYGLKLSGIGDQIALGAIQAGAQADRYVNQLTSQFMNNLFRQLQPAPQTPPGG